MYIVRNVTKGQIVDDDPPSDAIELDPDSFVKCCWTFRWSILIARNSYQ